jgi:hypothetical protein
MTRRRGRPKLDAEAIGFSPEVTIALRADDLAAVQRIAEQHDVSVSAVVRHAVRGYLHTRRAVAANPGGHPVTPVAPPNGEPRAPRSVTRRGSF